jgi:hypothetical protein
LIHRGQSRQVDRFGRARAESAEHHRPDAAEALPSLSRHAVQAMLGTALLFLTGGVLLFVVCRAFIERSAGAVLIVWSLGTVPAIWRACRRRTGT